MMRSRHLGSGIFPIANAEVTSAFINMYDLKHTLHIIVTNVLLALQITLQESVNIKDLKKQFYFRVEVGTIVKKAGHINELGIQFHLLNRQYKILL